MKITPPYTVEQRLLSTMLHRPSLIKDVLWNMYFTEDPAHHEIAAAVEMIYIRSSSNRPIDAINDLHDHVSSTIYEYVKELYWKVPPVPDIYQLILPKKLEEEAIELLKYFYQVVVDEEREGKEQIEIITEWLEYFVKRINQIRPIPYTQYETKHTLRKLICEWEQRKRGTCNIFTGFAGFDKQLQSGLERGNLYVLSGDATVCTETLLRMVNNITEEHRILYCSFRNTYEELVRELMLLYSNLTLDTFKPHLYEVPFRNKIADKAEQLFNNLVIYQTALPTLQELKETIHYYKANEKFSFTLMIIDDILSLTEGETNSPEQIVEELNEIAKELYLIVFINVPSTISDDELSNSPKQLNFKNNIFSIADVVMMLEKQNSETGEAIIKAQVVKSGTETLEDFMI